MYQPYILLIILVVAMALFIWNYWRYDVVAFMALIAALLTGIVPFDEAFTGFSNPAVITVGCVMILTGAVSQSGILDYIITRFEFLFSSLWLHIASLTVISAVLSAFMNNVGALGLMMPIAIKTFQMNRYSPSLVLMPIAFGSVLGGLTTVIGTPPNILISQIREDIIGQPFYMFDYTPVGFLVAIVGVIFISLVGWRFLPPRQKSTEIGDMFHMSDYMTEVVVQEESPFVNKTIRDMKEELDVEFELIAVIHKKTKKFAYSDDDTIHKNDTFIIEASHDNLEKLLSKAVLKIVSEKPFSKKNIAAKDLSIMEAVVPPGSDVVGRSAKTMRLRVRNSINLLALSRQGISFRKKLNEIRFLAGDIILLQGKADELRDTIVSLGFVPLAERDIAVGATKNILLPILFFFLSIMAAAFNILPIAVSFATAVLGLILFNVMPIRYMYRSIDWSVLLLLGAIIPVGQSIQSTGTADLITNGFMALAGDFSPVVALAAVLILTMTLSDLMNNAATAVVMAPIAIKVANDLQVSVDTFLMAVAVGASCSFLTPIAHQNNTMVMGPGGYQFFDYSRLGLPLEVLVVITSIPALLWFWPL